jgi:shikimate dehydrogenase
MDANKPQLNPQDHPGLDVYGVIGHPIIHSKSPVIHEYFAKQINEPIYYGKIFAELDAFAKTVQEFFARGGKGLNITVPFKLEAYEMAKKRTARAEIAKAANVLWLQDGELWCDNTDGVGFVRDLARLFNQQGIDVKKARVLILGAGGAAQGVIDPLMSLGIQDISIANRTHAKALDLAKQFPGLQAVEIHQLKNSNFPFDLILNATATGLSDSSPIELDLLKHISHSKTIAYDMVYGKETRFLKDAASLGLLPVDGLGMLVEQAADAFTTWRKPSVALDIQGALQATRDSYLTDHSRS